MQEQATPVFDSLPEIIQGGMGVGVSNWRLARAVAEAGQMGVVSGTALDMVMARRLQQGDPDGHIRRALARFPWPEMAQRVLERYLVPGGKEIHEPYKATPMPTWPLSPTSTELMIVANFVEVFLAREGHSSPIGINYLEKIQLPTLPSLLGAMLAGVDAVLMGGGIPLAIPGVLDRLSRWEAVELALDVDECPRDRRYVQTLDPRALHTGPPPALRRPKFLAIVSSDIIAKAFVRRANGFVDGFIVENHTAGGHNAPPRQKSQAQPRYTAKDVPNIAKIEKLGRPFWMAGGYASPAGLRRAREMGACGIQVGTPFAYCDESGIVPELKRRALSQCTEASLEVMTDFHASPTGYPFKIALVRDTAPTQRGPRKRVCDLGYLRQIYCKGDTAVGYRCPAEAMERYLAKGGSPEETRGKRCLCNGLLATIGLGQVRQGDVEPPIVTSGEELSFVPHLISGSSLRYSARDVIDYIKR
jgi:nitronate monooxygenase